MRSYNIGIVGCGAAALRYYAPVFKKLIPKINNLYLVDKSEDRAKQIAREIGKGEIIIDHHEIISKVQGVVIVLPHLLHYPVSMDFLKAGVHVLCEKPLAVSFKEAVHMNKIAEMNNVFLCANYTRRMFPSFLEVKKIIASGKLGKIKSIGYIEGNTFAWQNSTGFYVNPNISSKGVLQDNGSHVIDLICWWLDHKPDIKDYKDDSFGGPESVVRIKAESKGCEIDIFLNRLIDLENKFKIIGDRGSIEGRLFEWQDLKIQLNSGRIFRQKLRPKVKNYPDFVVPIVENFMKVIEGKTRPLISGTDVQNSVKFIDECYGKRSRFKMPWYENLPTSTRSDGVILVTGASGFIGGRLIEVLHLTGNRKVKAAIRQWSSAARLGRFPVKFVQMDLREKSEIEEALEGVTQIVHCAKGSEGVTVQGTKNLLDASLKKGVRRFVHISTAEVYGDVSGKITEDSPFQYTGNLYNRTKIDAEKACWQFYKQRLPVTVLRPSIVYGPFSKNWTMHFANMFVTGKGKVYEKHGRGKCNLVYIDDLVQAILLSFTCEKAIGHAFNINGPEVITWNEYFKKFNKSMGLPPLRSTNTIRTNAKTVIMEPVRVLGRFARAHFMDSIVKVAEFSEFAKTKLKQTENTLKMTPSPDELKLFSKDVVFSCEKASKLLGFTPSISIDEGLSATTKWIEHQGYLLK